MIHPNRALLSYLLQTAVDTEHAEWREGSPLASRTLLSLTWYFWTTGLRVLFGLFVQVAHELSNVWNFFLASCPTVESDFSMGTQGST